MKNEGLHILSIVALMEELIRIFKKTMKRKEAI